MVKMTRDRRRKNARVATLSIRPSTFELINYRALEKQISKPNIRGVLRPITFEKPNIPMSDFYNLISGKKGDKC